MYQRKLQFFNTGSRALSAMSDYQDLYACPICQTLFDVSAIASRDLTLEDSPQRSMGGKPIALTCRRCNSTAGHTIDAALKQREDFVSLSLGLFGRGGNFQAKAARLSAGGVTTNIRIRGEGKYVTFEVPKKQNHPDTFRAQLGAHAPKGEVPDGDPREFKIHAPMRFDWRHAGIGDLKSAYIAAFATYGYRYAFDSSLDLVREQIRNPYVELIQPACWYQTSGPLRGPEILGIEKPFRGLLVPLGRAMVGLPWWGDPKIFYAQLNGLLGRGPVDITVTRVGWPTGLEMRLDFQAAPDGALDQGQDAAS